jgi:hypothetical protein
MGILEHCIITYLETFFHMVLNGFRFRGCEGSLGVGKERSCGSDEVGCRTMMQSPQVSGGPVEVGCSTMMMMHSLEVSGFPRKHLDASSPNSFLFYTQSPAQTALH